MIPATMPPSPSTPEPGAPPAAATATPSAPVAAPSGPPRPTILICDDEENVRRFLEMPFRKRGYNVFTAATGQAALETLAAEAVDVMVLDVNLPDLNGLAVLEQAAAAHKRLTTVVITAYEDVRTAVEAMKRGAFDYLTKPFDFARLENIVAKAADMTALRKEVAVLRYGQDRAPHTELVGNSPKMAEVFTVIRKVSAGPFTGVLITGESGTGKELVAKAIHDNSPNAKRPFVAVNCTALAETLLESELFGHERGAFTDAREAKEGLFELADGGTIFLDEIGDMDLKVQAKLLRALESREIRRVGGTKTIKVSVRAVAATNRDLAEMVRRGTFREDLYYRLRVVPIHLPALRERREDILPIAEQFLRQLGAGFGKHIRGFTAEAAEAMTHYGWPGNVRELRNVLERVLLLEDTDLIAPRHLPPEISGGAGRYGGVGGVGMGGAGAAANAVSVETAIADFKAAKDAVVERFERKFLTDTLARHGGNVSRAASACGLERGSFQRLMRKYDLRSGEFKG
jgi:DNA-binding NtrC family response regulator